MPRPRALRYASFSVQYVEEAIAPAVRRRALRCRRLRPARSSAATICGSTGGRLQILDVDADVAAVAERADDEAARCARG